MHLSLTRELKFWQPAATMMMVERTNISKWTKYKIARFPGKTISKRRLNLTESENLEYQKWICSFNKICKGVIPDLYFIRDALRSRCPKCLLVLYFTQIYLSGTGSHTDTIPEKFVWTTFTEVLPITPRSWPSITFQTGLKEPSFPVTPLVARSSN